MTWTQLSALAGLGDFDWQRGLLAAVAVLVLSLLRRPLVNLALWPLLGVLSRFSQASTKDLRQVLRDPLTLTPVLLGIWAAARIMRLEGSGDDAVRLIMLSLAVASVTWILARTVQIVADASTALHEMLGRELVDWGARALVILVWIIGAVAILETWGVRVAPLIASLGIIGVAVALGAQDFFRNLISGLVVLSEKRYRIGDRIQLAGVVDGGVEEIGFRSTRVRLFDGAPVSVPNAMLADGALVNYGEIPWRRILLHVGLEYRTTVSQLRQVREKIDEYLQSSGDFVPAEETTLEVRIDRFSDSSIDIMVYAFANTREWAKWIATKERLMFRIMEIVEEAGTGFAFPSRSLYMETKAATPEESAPKRVAAALAAGDSAAPAMDSLATAGIHPLSDASSTGTATP